MYIDSTGQKESYSVVWSDWSKLPRGKLDNLYNRDKQSIGNIGAPLGYFIGFLDQEFRSMKNYKI